MKTFIILLGFTPFIILCTLRVQEALKNVGNIVLSKNDDGTSYFVF